MSDAESDRINTLLLAPFRQQVTGVQGTVIWIAAGEFSVKEAHHGPLIKVMPGNVITTNGLADAALVTLTNPPEVIGDLPARINSQAVEFVEANRDVLLRHWRNELDTAEMLARLVRIERP